jgi:hypothetical protein
MNAKKWTLLLFMVIFAAGMAFAQEDEGIGLDVGVELGFGNVADEAEISVTPNIVYENSFGALDVYGEVDYTITFADETAHSVYFEIELGYNFELSDTDVFSIIVNNNNTLYLAPSLGDENDHEGVFEPSLKYTHTFGFGDLYGQLGFPIAYLTGLKDEDAQIGTTLTLGLASGFGLGLELSGTYILSPESDYAESGILISFERGLFYGEVEVTTDKEFKGFGINPEVDLSFGAWTAIIRAEMEKAEDEDWAISPFIGATYSF